MDFFTYIDPVPLFGTKKGADTQICARMIAANMTAHPMIFRGVMV